MSTTMLCKAECGENRSVSSFRKDSLVCNECLASRAQKELEFRRKYDGNQSDRPEYKIYQTLKQRCHNPKSSRFKNYGNRNISVSDDWGDFDTFIKEVGPRPSGVSDVGRSLFSLERIDNDRGYSAENTKWATREEQSRNRSNTRFVEINGEIKPVIDACVELGLTHPGLTYRMDKGLSGDDLLKPPQRQTTHQYKGREITNADLSRLSGIEPRVLLMRIKRGTSPEDAVAMGPSIPRTNRSK